MRTHAHGQGHADLNWLIPETVAMMDVRKGPHFAEEGDFSSVGSLRIGGVTDHVLHPIEPLAFRVMVAGAF
jgi:hypothetical protein